MPVETVLQEYKDNLPKWELVKAFVSEDIKALNKQLRVIDASDKSQDNIDRNNEYKEGAVLENVTKRTHDGMVGAVYRKAPQIELPQSVEYLEDDVNGSGVGLTQFSKKVLSNTMQRGRDGVLVDFPRSEGGTVAETKDKTARLIEYTAEQIINWRTEAGKLSLVVLKETVQLPVDGDPFATNPKDQYRVLRLVGGSYHQSLWMDGKPIEDEIPITDYNGKPFKEITFQFVGTVNNDTEIDPSLLYSIAAVNKGHFRNSADLEENSFIHGQLTLGITSDLPSDEWSKMNPNGIKVGSRNGHYLGSTGGFHSVQAQANSLTQGMMSDKEAQMVALGARLIQNGGNEREMAVLARVGAETATLSSLTHNVSIAISQCIEWAEMYMSPSISENVFTLNQEFVPESIDAQTLMAYIQLYDRGRIAAADFHEKLQAARIIADDRELEDIEAESEEISPLQTTVNVIE